MLLYHAVVDSDLCDGLNLRDFRGAATLYSYVAASGLVADNAVVAVRVQELEHHVAEFRFESEDVDDGL